MNVPGSQITGLRGGIHNSVTRTVLKPTHMVGGYAQLSYGFNYYGTVGSNRDEFVIVRKRNKIDSIALMLRGAIDAQSQVGLMLNVKRTDLDAVLSVLPALNSPTVSQLSNSEWVAVNTIVDERTARDVIPRLKAANATGIVEYPLNKVVL